MANEWNKPEPTYELSSDLEQPPAGKIVETKTVYSVSDPPISRQLDMQEAAREGTPTLTDSDGNDLYPPAVCNWIVWSEERIIALERDLASATAALAEERAARKGKERERALIEQITVERCAQECERVGDNLSYGAGYALKTGARYIRDIAKLKPTASDTLAEIESELAVARQQAGMFRTALEELRKEWDSRAQPCCGEFDTCERQCVPLVQHLRAERDALALALVEWQGKAEDECSKNERLATDEGDHSASEAHSIDADAIHSLNPPSRERGEELLKDAEKWRAHAAEIARWPDSGERGEALHERMTQLLNAASVADWEQVVLNGGPPCFHIDDGSFCLRAQRWAGHTDMHEFVTLHAAIDSAIKEGRG